MNIQGLDKSKATVRYFWHSSIHRGTTFMYLQYSRLPLIYHLLPNVWKASYTISTSIFVDVPYWPAYITDKFISCVVPGLSQWFFHFGEEMESHGLRRKQQRLVVQDTIIFLDNERSHTAAAVTERLRRWKWEILENLPYSPDMSSCDYELFHQSERTTARDPIKYKRWTYPCYRAVNTEH